MGWGKGPPVIKTCRATGGGCYIIIKKKSKAENSKKLKLDGSETFDLLGIKAGILPGMDVEFNIHRTNGESETVPLKCRIDTLDEVEYFKAGGILQYVLRNMRA